MAPRLIAVAVCLAILAWELPVAAWGEAAHRAVARVAEQRLMPRAKAQVAALLGRDSLADVSLWADAVRDTTHPHTRNWHFVNIPIGASGYLRTRDCRPTPEGDCVVAAIERLQVELRTGATTQARREALKFLVHFVGDIHQPLHTGHNNDRGGNSRQIALIGNAQNLHSAWDSGIIRAARRNENALVNAANRFLRTQDPATIANTSPIDWANEGVRLARDVAYPGVDRDNAITASERREAIGVIEQRVGMAGVRLAAVLNRIFANGTTDE